MFGDYLKRKSIEEPQAPPSAPPTSKRQRMLGKLPCRAEPVRMGALLTELNMLWESEREERHSQEMPCNHHFAEEWNTIPSTVGTSQHLELTPGLRRFAPIQVSAETVMRTERTPMRTSTPVATPLKSSGSGAETKLPALDAEKENYTPLKTCKTTATATPASSRNPLSVLLIGASPALEQTTSTEIPHTHSGAGMLEKMLPPIQETDVEPEMPLPDNFSNTIPSSPSRELVAVSQSKLCMPKVRHYAISSQKMLSSASRVSRALLPSNVPLHPHIAAAQQQQTQLQQQSHLQAELKEPSPSESHLLRKSEVSFINQTAAHQPLPTSSRDTLISKPPMEQKISLVIDKPLERLTSSHEASNGPSSKCKPSPSESHLLKKSEVSSITQTAANQPQPSSSRETLVSKPPVEQKISLVIDKPMEKTTSSHEASNGPSSKCKPSPSESHLLKKSEVSSISQTAVHQSLPTSSRETLISKPPVEQKISLVIDKPLERLTSSHEASNGPSSNSKSSVAVQSAPPQNVANGSYKSFPNDKEIFQVPKPVIATTTKHYGGVNQLFVNGKAYTILSLLGRGGSSMVYQVLDPSTSKLLAIKCVNLSDTDESISDGYLNEIKLLAQLQNGDSVIRMFDFEHRKEESMLFVVMEKGDTDLSKLIKDVCRSKKISAAMIVYYWTEMLEAVSFIHRRGTIHSDLKPANFLLVAGRLKLIDFGIASSVQGDMTSVVKDNMTGTYNYISPEAICSTGGADGQRYKITYKSDVWSLGCILYNLVYGQTPFQNIQGQFQKLNAIVNPSHQIPFPAPSVEGCPPTLVQALQACLVRNPKNRPSVNELLQLPYLGHVGPERILLSQIAQLTASVGLIEEIPENKKSPASVLQSIQRLLIENQSSLPFLNAGN